LAWLGNFDTLAKFYAPKEVDIGHFVGKKVQIIPGIVDPARLLHSRLSKPRAFGSAIDLKQRHHRCGDASFRP
jgi:hypothetical protein